MRPPAYIGITGFSSRSQIEGILKEVPDNSPLIMCGVLVSDKWLDGVALDKPKRYPQRDKLGGLFIDHPNLLNIVHFNTHRRDKLIEDLEQIAREAGPTLRGFQLNMTWPELDVLTHYKTMHPEHMFILSCDRKAIELANRSPKELAARVSQYHTIADYVLLDASGGEGAQFDLGLARECFAEFEKIEDMGFGIAGGLGPHTLRWLRPLWAKYSDFSINAESRLRQDPPDDNFIQWAALVYYSGAREIFDARVKSKSRGQYTGTPSPASH